MAFTRYRRALRNGLKSNLARENVLTSYIIISTHNETRFVKIT